MMTHFILLSSSYSEGTRIALDFIIESETDKVRAENTIKQIQTKCGEDVSLSIHCLDTADSTWQSVVDTDLFFKSVRVIDSVEEFIRLIEIDRDLSPLSVARYILSKIKCTHLQLEKLIYLCFADYLCLTDEKLFDDTIYAFKYGPVVKTVFEKYKGKGNEDISLESVDKNLEMPLRSLITFSRNGHRKLISIDKTLKKYGDFSASKLVEITHTVGSPWQITYDGTMFKEIPVDVIKQKHIAEENAIRKVS